MGNNWALALRSVISKMWMPLRTSSTAWQRNSSIASASERSSANVQSNVASGNSSRNAYVPWCSAAICPSDRKGEGRTSPGRGACLSSKCGHGPRRVRKESTHDSRRTLTEEPVQGPRCPRQGRDGGIVSHRPNGILALQRHGTQEHLHVFARVAEPALQPRNFVFREKPDGFCNRLQRNVVDQTCVGCELVEVVIDALGKAQLLLFEIKQDHLSWS